MKTVTFKGGSSPLVRHAYIVTYRGERKRFLEGVEISVSDELAALLPTDRFEISGDEAPASPDPEPAADGPLEVTPISKEENTL